MIRLTTLLTRAGAAAALPGLALLAAGCGSATSATSPSSQRSAASDASPRTLPGASLPGGSLTPGASPSCPPTGPAQVYNAGTAEPVPPLDAVTFVSADQGWAAGAGRIVATSNGGRTWRVQYSGSGTLDQVDFTDARHGWAAGPGTLLATDNGGATWTALPDACGSIDSVHFVTPETGYAIAGGSQVRIDGGVPAPVNGGELLETADGGRTWQTLPGSPAQAQTACFANSADGFVGTPGKIWRSTDGGRHWTLSFTEPPKAAGRSGRPGDTAVLECAGASAAWVDFLGSGAALGHAPYIAFATQDAKNWHVLFEETYTESAALPEVHAPDGPGTYPGPFSAISPGNAAFIGSIPAEGFGAAPLDMVSGGSTLTKDGNVGGLTQAIGAAFTSPAKGWLVGTDQTVAGKQGNYVIESTADGGRTWTRQYQVG